MELLTAQARTSPLWLFGVGYARGEISSNWDNPDLPPASFPLPSMCIITFTEVKKRHLLLFLKCLALHSEVELHRKGHFHTRTLNLPCALSFVPRVPLLDKTGGAGVAQ